MYEGKTKWKYAKLIQMDNAVRKKYLHFVTIPSTQTIEPMKPERRSLGVTLLETKGPSNPTRTCSPSLRYLGLMLRATSVSASENGCIYSVGFLRSLADQKNKKGRSVKRTLNGSSRLVAESEYERILNVLTA